MSPQCKPLPNIYHSSVGAVALIAHVIFDWLLPPLPLFCSEFIQIYFVFLYWIWFCVFVWLYVFFCFFLFFFVCFFLHSFWMFWMVLVRSLDEFPATEICCGRSALASSSRVFNLKSNPGWCPLLFLLFLLLLPLFLLLLRISTTALFTSSVVFFSPFLPISTLGY